MKRLSLFLTVSLALHLALQLAPNFLLEEPDVQLQASNTPITVRTMVMNSDEPVEEEPAEEPEEIVEEPEPEPVDKPVEKPEPRPAQPAPEPEETVGKAEPEEAIEEPEPEPAEEPVEPEVQEGPGLESVDPNPSKPVRRTPDPVVEPVDVPPQPEDPMQEVQPEPDLEPEDQAVEPVGSPDQSPDPPDEPREKDQTEESADDRETDRSNEHAENPSDQGNETDESVEENNSLKNPNQPAGPKTTPDWQQSDPEYRHNPSPDYPRRAVRRGVEGTVELFVEIDRTGRVRTVELETSSGSQLLDEAAKRAVRTWEFEPRTEKGTATSSWAIVPVRFRLK